MLEIQSVMLEKLAAEENHFKNLTEILKLVLLNFDEQIKEIEETLIILKY